MQGLCRVPSFWRTYQPTTSTGASSCAWRSRTRPRRTVVRRLASRGATPAPLAAPADNTSCYSASCSVPDCAKVMLIVNFNKCAIQGICWNVFLFYQTSMLRITDLKSEEEIIVNASRQFYHKYDSEGCLVRIETCWDHERWGASISVYLNQTLSPHICDWNNSFSQYRWKIEIKGTTKENMFFFQDRIKDQSVSNKRMRQKPPIHFYRNYLLYLHTRAYKSPRYSRILVFYVVCTISCNDSALWAITRGLCMGGNTH